MNRFKTLLAFIFITSIFHGQDVKITSEYSSNNLEISDILKFGNIDFYNVKLVGKNITDKSITLICKEMWDGKLTNSDTLINRSKLSTTLLTKSDTLNLKVYAKITAEPKLVLRFKFPNFEINKAYNAMNTDFYSLREIGSVQKIDYDKDFYAFAYILPIEKDGFLYYCAVENSGANVENWGSELAIPHYLIFEMKFNE